MAQTDNFNAGADLTELTSWNANWVRVSTDTNLIRSATGYAGQSQGGGQAIYYWSAGSLGNDHYAQIVCKVAGGAWQGPCVRVGTDTGDANLDGYIVWAGPGGVLYKQNNGGFTSLGSVSAANANDVLRLEASGSNITYKVNGSTDRAASDSTFASGFPGCFTGGTLERFDDFEADALGGGGGGDTNARLLGGDLLNGGLLFGRLIQ